MHAPAVVLAKYVFLDVVSFSRRTVEDQSYVVGALNSIVNEALARASSAREVTKKQIILLPTGDGLCIALVDLASPDFHVRLALDILRRIHEHNATVATVEKRDRAFEVRVGINSNHDNLVTDVNNRRNIAGAGINMAQRIMSMADGGQLLLGTTDVNALAQRDGYTDAFREYLATVKHGTKVAVYQLVSAHPGLNVEEPSQLSRFKPDQAFSAHLIDVDYLRGLPANVLQEAELAIRRAAFPHPAPPEVESFLETMHRLGRTPTVWRSDYRVVLTVQRDPENPAKYRSRAHFKWTFMNHTSTDVVVPQTLYTTPALPVEGKSPQEILKLHKVATDLERLSGFSSAIIEDGNSSRVSFSVNVPPNTGTKGFPFGYSSAYVQDLGQPWFVVVYSPVCNVTLTLHHPENLEPELYVFGLRTSEGEATPLEPADDYDDHRRWVYDGWLLAQHGLCLVLSEKDEVIEVPPAKVADGLQ